MEMNRHSPEAILPEELESEVVLLCKKYQEERFNGHWYITGTGLKKISQLISNYSEYSKLTKKQKDKFRQDCIDTSMGSHSVRTWMYYLSI
jgi:hypothetical protein